MFISFHLSISFVVDVDLRSDACGVPPWIWFLIHMVQCTNFANVLENRCMQSATDDPGFCSSFHGTSDSPPMTGYICQCTANI